LNGDLKAPKFDFVSNARPSMFAYPSSTKPPKKETVAKVAAAVLSTTNKVKAREKRKATAEGDSMDTDEKLETGKAADGDVTMHIDESGHGDVSPINDSISNLPDDSKPASKRKAEPSFEILPNFSRVTTAQVAYISFPTECRYQPVRPVSTKPTPGIGKGPEKSPMALHGLTSEKYAGRGGILILKDLRPDEDAEFIEFEPPAPSLPDTTGAANVPSSIASGSQASAPHISLDESAPEANPPEPFEYPFDSDA